MCMCYGDTRDEEPFSFMADENNERLIDAPKPISRGRKKSIVWDYFTIEKINDECSRAFCDQCRKSFAYITASKLAGTSHLRRHMASCISRYNNQGTTQVNGCTPIKTDASICNTLPTKRIKINPVSEFLKFDQDSCNREIAKMIMLHEYPLNIVEHTGFIDFVLSIQPQFRMLNADTIQGELVKIYTREKQSILNLLGGSVGRVSLALDMWTSDQGLAYLLLTGCFVDSDWKLQRRLLNVAMLPFPDSEFAFSHAVIACFNDWGLDNKLFAITLDQSFTNEAVRRNLRGLFSVKNPLILDGQLLMENCYARVMGRLAQHILGSMSEIVTKVRNSVKYVKTIDSHEETFIRLKQQLQNPSTKSLIIDDQTKWDTTYHMLVAASEVKEVFSCLDTSDPNYKESPSMEEWEEVELLCIYLKILFDGANILTAPTYPTADVFFHEVWHIQTKFIHAAMSEDAFVRDLTKPLQEILTEYWKDCGLLLAIAVVMDPRFKMKLVEFTYSKIFGKEAETMIKIVDEGIHELYLDYTELSLPAPTFKVEDFEDVKIEMTHEDTLLSTSVDLFDFDVYMSEIMDSQHMKSELDLYLEEPLFPRGQQGSFNALAWWKENMQKYPTLSKLASDILCIPVSTVDTDSVFETKTKKMGQSLTPSMVQALFCAKDWIKYESSKFSHTRVKLEY